MFTHVFASRAHTRVYLKFLAGVYMYKWYTLLAYVVLLMNHRRTRRRLLIYRVRFLLHVTRNGRRDDAYEIASDYADDGGFIENFYLICISRGPLNTIETVKK